MKKILIAFIVFISSALATCAQDLITKNDGSIIEVNTQEVNMNESYVKYRLSSNPDGPLYTMPLSEIRMIQYADGTYDLFESEEAAKPQISYPLLVENKKYRQLKEIYDPAEYRPGFNDRYNPGWIGVASFFIPGLGQAITDEWGRAAGFFFGTQLFICGTAVPLAISYQNKNFQTSIPLLLIMAGVLGIDIWSVCDAVRIAKVKNMYYQDLYSTYSRVEFGVEPYLASLPYPSSSGMAAAAGLTLRISF